MSEDDKNDPARKYKAYLEEWIKRDDKQRALRPKVTRMLGTSTWQVDAMDELREQSPEMAREIEGEIEQSLPNFKKMMPLPVEYEESISFTSSASVIATSTGVFTGLASMKQPDRESAPRITALIGRYEDLVAQQGRADEAAQRIVKLFPNLSTRFEVVLDIAQVALGDRLAEERAALEMRTFLHKFAGELFAKARKHADEKMAWELMVERLSSAAGRQTLLGQGETHSGLTDTLSNLGKGRRSAFTFSETWARFVDHVFIVCGLVLGAQSIAGDRVG